jgi:hypothetical protein
MTTTTEVHSELTQDEKRRVMEQDRKAREQQVSTTYKDFASDRMRDDDDSPFTYSVLPFCLSPEERDLPPHPNSHREPFFDVTRQIIELLSAALKERNDVWKPIRIMIQAERLIGEYTSEGFSLLLPIEQDLRETLRKAWRIERRIFIKRALSCPPEQIPEYREYLKEEWLSASPWGHPGDAVEDFRAVEQHLKEGQALFDDLHKRRKLVG